MASTGRARGGGSAAGSAAALLRASAVAVATALSACAGSAPNLAQPDFVAANPKAGEPENNDPYEKQNRATFADNQKLNENIVYPIANAYTENVPQEVRDKIAAFSTNLGEPLVFANDVLQLRFDAAAVTFGRFAVNSTVGIGGLFDVAATQDLEHQSGDFGQTLYVWGMRDSPYLVLPVVGPTNVRDAVGGGLEIAAQIPAVGLFPGQFATVLNTAGTVGGVTSPVAKLDQVHDLQSLEQGSLDFYAMLRSVTEQKRQAELDQAVKESLFSAVPNPDDPADVHFAMTIEPSPAFIDKPQPLKPKPVERPPAAVSVGAPVIVE